MITIPTATELQADILSYFAAYFNGRDLGTGSYFGQWARTLAEALLGIYQEIRDAETGTIPQSTTATARLDEFAELFGLSDGSGGIGRKVPTTASGGAATFTYSGAGPFPYTLTAGQTMTAPDGVTVLETAANIVWLAAAGTQSGTINAVTAGTAGNLLIGAVLSLVSPPASISNSVTLSTATSGGEDEESDSALLGRILDRLQNPPKGGAAADWKAWALGVTGVDEAWVYPRYAGTGSVKVVIAQSGSGTTRGVSGAIETDVLDAFDLARLVCVESRSAQSPYMPAGAACVIVVQPTPNSAANAFDLDETGGAFTVASSTASSITFNNNWPDITVQLAAGVQPRIQVITTGVVLPQVLTVTAYNAGTKTATISGSFTAPTAGDAVYSAGNCVTPIAQAILDHVDSLGPSKVSGFNDATDTWSDTLYLDQIRRASLDAVDENGNTLCDKLASAPTINGVSADVQAQDDGSHGPQLLYASHITVKR